MLFSLSVSKSRCFRYKEWQVLLPITIDIAFIVFMNASVLYHGDLLYFTLLTAELFSQRTHFG